MVSLHMCDVVNIVNMVQQRLTFCDWVRICFRQAAKVRVAFSLSLPSEHNRDKLLFGLSTVAWEGEIVAYGR